MEKVAREYHDVRPSVDAGYVFQLLHVQIDLLVGWVERVETPLLQQVTGQSPESIPGPRGKGDLLLAQVEQDVGRSDPKGQTCLL